MVEPHTITIDLGDERERVEARVRSGAYASASDVVRAGLEALEREEVGFADGLGAKVQEALDDPRPSVSVDEVFGQLEQLYREDVKRSGHEA